jgi:predicted nucleic acid-binding protein
VWYWDTSALLKLYLPEHDSAYFLGLIETAAQPVFSSAIAATEVACALLRKEHSAGLKPGGAGVLLRRFRADCHAGRLVLVPYGADVAAETERLAKTAFAQCPPVVIRSLDVIHLASASIMKATAVVATDNQLRDLAQVLGIPVLPEPR